MVPEERMGLKKRTARSGPRKVEGAAPQASRLDPVARAALELWITLGRHPWSSVVLVPAEPDGSTASLAKLLADVGQKLSFVPVTAIAVSALEYGSALALADLQGHVERERRRAVVDAPATATAEAQAPAPALEDVEPAADSAPARPGPVEALTVVAPARLVIAIPSVIHDPLGLSATQQADAVLVAVEMGRTRTSALRRTIELIGKERVTGCVLV